MNHRGLLTAAVAAPLARFQAVGATPAWLDRPMRPVVASAAFIHRKTERWGAVIRYLGITLE